MDCGPTGSGAATGVAAAVSARSTNKGQEANVGLWAPVTRHLLQVTPVRRLTTYTDFGTSASASGLASKEASHGPLRPARVGQAGRGRRGRNAEIASETVGTSKVGLTRRSICTIGAGSVRAEEGMRGRKDGFWPPFAGSEKTGRPPVSRAAGNAATAADAASTLTKLLFRSLLGAPSESSLTARSREVTATFEAGAKGGLTGT